MFRKLLFTLLLAPILAAEEKPNILLICIDDLRPELKSFGAEYIHSPHIDSLAARGRAFHRHYVQAPTCGASRYALLTGQFGSASNTALIKRAKKPSPDSLPAHFRKHGYTTISVGKVSHYPGGRGGADWDDEAHLEMPNSWDRNLMPCGPWQHPRGAMHGLANGRIREKKSSTTPALEAAEGPDEIYPDGLIANEALAQLKLVSAAKKPFFLAIGFIRPHLPFGAPKKYLDLYKDTTFPAIPHPAKPEGKTTYHRSGEFYRYDLDGRDPNTDPQFATDLRRHYAACVSYADAQVGKLLAKVPKNTLIILWGDHGWHLGEHAVWGKHTLFEESLCSPLIIIAPQIKQPGQPTQQIVESLDLFPTLCDLANLPKPAHLRGQSLLPQLRDPAAATRGNATSYYRRARTVRTEHHRLIVHQDGHLELYDHRSAEGEMRNIAESESATAERLRKLIRE